MLLAPVREAHGRGDAIDTRHHQIDVLRTHTEPLADAAQGPLRLTVDDAELCVEQWASVIN